VHPKHYSEDAVLWVMQISLRKLLAGLMAGGLAIACCDAQQPADAEHARQRQLDFLNQVRSSDPQREVIDRAVFNGRNELGLIVDRTVEMQKIPPLMRTLLTKMARQFPNQDLTIVAYAPSDPPLKLGTAHLDARTGDMAYSSEHR
jgi:hypothetical protein